MKTWKLWLLSKVDLVLDLVLTAIIMTYIISPRLLVIVPLVLCCSQVLAELMVCLAFFGVYSGLELARLGDVL